MEQGLERTIRRHLEDIETELREAGMDRTARELRRAIDSLPCMFVEMPIKERDLYRDLYAKAVEAATPYLQCGGKYAHLLRPGDDIITDGIPALVKALDEALAQKEEQPKNEMPALRPGDVVRVSFAECAFMLVQVQPGGFFYLALRLGHENRNMRAFEATEIGVSEIVEVYRDGKLLWRKGGA